MTRYYIAFSLNYNFTHLILTTEALLWGNQ